MNLRTMAERLLTVPNLPLIEAQVLQFVLTTNGDNDLEGMLYPAVEGHIRGRYEWFFTPAGDLRRMTR